MTRNEAKVYWVRYSIAEAIFRVAAWVKPSNYEFDVVRATVHMMIEAHQSPQESASE